MRTIKFLAAIAAATALTLGLTGCYDPDDVNTRPSQVEPGNPEPGPIQQDGAAPIEDAYTFEATVRRVIDGDTITVFPTEDLPANYGWGEEKTEHAVRILGLDTPEMNTANNDPEECGAREALQRLSSLLIVNDTGVPVRVVYDPKTDQFDRFDRSLAYVELPDGTDVGRLLIAEGLSATWYPKGEPEPTRYPSYYLTQQDAASAAVGSHAVCESIGR